MHYVNFALLLVNWAGLAYLFFNNNNNKKKLYLWQPQRPFHTNSEISAISPRLKEMPSLSVSLNTGAEEVSVNKQENKVISVTYTFNCKFISNVILLVT